MTPARVYDRLVHAGALFATAVVLHNADHVRRGADAVALDVFWLGTAAVVAEVALVTLVCQRHRAAPLVAAAAGFVLAGGYVVVHFLPERRWFSDPLVASSRVDRWSIAAASVEVVAALVLGVAGLAALNKLRRVAPAVRRGGQERSLRLALLHPLALTFALSQALTLWVSFAQV